MLHEDWKYDTSFFFFSFSNGQIWGEPRPAPAVHFVRGSTCETHTFIQRSRDKSFCFVCDCNFPGDCGSVGETVHIHFESPLHLSYREEKRLWFFVEDNAINSDVLVHPRLKSVTAKTLTDLAAMLWPYYALIYSWDSSANVGRCFFLFIFSFLCKASVVKLCAVLRGSNWVQCTRERIYRKCIICWFIKQQ